MRDRAATDLFEASVTDIRSLVETVAVFPFKAGTDLVAFGAGPADTLTDHDLFAYICLFTSETMNAKVVLISKASFVVCICHPMETDLFGDCCRIFTEELGNIFKRSTLI